MEYVMLITGPDDEWDAFTPADIEAAMGEIGAWVGKWQAAGKIKPGGAELDTSRSAKTVRKGPDGPVVTDGPYLELKEVVGGIIYLIADDIDEAVAIASGWPALTERGAVEVRPVMQR